MKRDYDIGESDSVIFFIGKEVEHTPAFGMNTLFVTGIQPTEDIETILSKQNAYLDTSKHIRHIFFGANHSFNPTSYEDWEAWESMVQYFLNKGELCSLDIPLSAVEEFNEGGLNDYNNFIPQIRVSIPYIKLWNYNTMIKIDDKDFNATNPGVWTHSLHKLKDREVFTDWSQDKNDQVLK